MTIAVQKLLVVPALALLCATALAAPEAPATLVTTFDFSGGQFILARL